MLCPKSSQPFLRIIANAHIGRFVRHLSQKVEYKFEGEVAIITLNNPKSFNALTVSMGKDFRIAVDDITSAAKSQIIRSCVLTGAGKAFSAGGDLLWLRERHTASSYSNNITMVDFYESFLCLRKIPVPLIAAINGAAVGAGAALTLACDIRVASNLAQIGFTFAKLGIHPGMGATVLLPRLVGQEAASRILLTGQMMSSGEAKTAGVISEAVDPEKVVGHAIALARLIGGNSPIAVQSCLATLRNQKFDGLESGLAREAAAQALAYASSDFLKGLDAVASKSTPHFKGWDS